MFGIHFFYSVVLRRTLMIIQYISRMPSSHQQSVSVKLFMEKQYFINKPCIHCAVYRCFACVLKDSKKDLFIPTYQSEAFMSNKILLQKSKMTENNQQSYKCAVRFTRKIQRCVINQTLKMTMRTK